MNENVEVTSQPASVSAPLRWGPHITQPPKWLVEEINVHSSIQAHLFVLF